MCHDCVKVQHPERVGDINSYNRFAYMKIVLESISKYRTSQEDEPALYRILFCG